MADQRKDNKDLCSDNVVWHKHTIKSCDRVAMKGHKSLVVWFTGLSGSGKSTIANQVEVELFNKGYHTYLLDGDNVRHGLSGDLGFSDEDRRENIRRIGELSKLFADAGLILLSAFISPFASDRDKIRGQLPAGLFYEVYINTPFSICESRDPKGLYQQSRAGQIENFTGIGSDYDVPQNPDLTLSTADKSIDECARAVVTQIENRVKINH